MKDETKNGYIAGIISIIIVAFFLINVPTIGLDTGGQFLLILGLIFGVLGVGSIWKPDTIGSIVSHWFENIGEKERSSYKQTQYRPKSSPQAFTKRGNVIIKQNFYGSKKRKSKKRSGQLGPMAIIGIIILALVVIATWPKLQIQTKDFNGIVDSSNNDFFIKATVWNRGGSISGYSIITPTVCLSARGEGVTCTHQGYDEMMDCINSMCSNIAPGGLSPERTFNFKINETYDEIEFKIIATGTFGPFPVAGSEKQFSCIKTDTNQYNCTESL